MKFSKQGTDDLHPIQISSFVVRLSCKYLRLSFTLPLDSFRVFFLMGNEEPN